MGETSADDVGLGSVERIEFLRSTQRCRLQEDMPALPLSERLSFERVRAFRSDGWWNMVRGGWQGNDDGVQERREDGLRGLKASYAVDDKGLEKQSAVAGLVERGVNHSRGMVE